MACKHVYHQVFRQRRLSLSTAQHFVQSREIMLNNLLRWIHGQVKDVSWTEAILAQTLQKRLAILLHCMQVAKSLFVLLIFLVLLPDNVERGHSENESILVVRLKPVGPILFRYSLGYCHRYLN